MADKIYQVDEAIFDLYNWAREYDCECDIEDMLSDGATLTQLRVRVYQAKLEMLEIEVTKERDRADKAEKKLSHIRGGEQ